MAQGEFRHVVFIAPDGVDDPLDARGIRRCPVGQHIFALGDDLDVEGLVVHHVEGPLAVVAAFADPADAVQNEGPLALLFLQRIDVGNILGLHHVDLAVRRNDILDLAAEL